MKTVIFLNGNINNYDFYKPIIGKNDYIICADGGYRHALNLGITPDIVVGDMDSAGIALDGLNTEIYPTEKDLTDGEIAVRHAVDKTDCDDIIILGGIGDRFDHTLCNVFLLKIISDAGKKGVIINETNEIYMTSSQITLTGMPGDTVSIIPIVKANGIMTQNLKYALDNFNLEFGTSRGISNIMLKELCTITVDDGLLVVIKSSDAE